MTADPLSAAIEAAVERAVAAQIPKIVEAVKSSAQPPPPPPNPTEDRFVRMAEVARLLGINRATVWKWERAGKLPARRRVGSAVGYLMSDIKAIQVGRTA
jgi:predicted DNA-binding transcriptional regulator AlpA